jgi:GNAT superfamily N-acetyltransferase
MNLTYIFANTSDLEDLLDIRIQAMKESLEHIGRFDVNRARERFENGFSPAFTRYICFEGVRVGFMVLKPLEQALHLDHLYILPQFQRRGIGTAVLEKVFAEADAANLPVKVGALKGSQSNKFYMRNGFKLVDQGEWDLYYVRLN